MILCKHLKKVKKHRWETQLWKFYLSKPFKVLGFLLTQVCFPLMLGRKIFTGQRAALAEEHRRVGRGDGILSCSQSSLGRAANWKAGHVQQCGQKQGQGADIDCERTLRLEELQIQTSCWHCMSGLGHRQQWWHWNWAIPRQAFFITDPFVFFTSCLKKKKISLLTLPWISKRLTQGLTFRRVRICRDK